MNEKFDVCYICVNFNGSEYTKKFIDSVKSQTVKSLAVVIDNSSQIDDWERVVSYVAKDDEAVVLHRSAVNLGYFGGLNLGMKFSNSAKYLVVGNNDLEFDRNFSERIISSKYEEDVYVVCPDVITDDGYHQNPHCINRVSAIRKFLYKIYYVSYELAMILTFVSNMLKKMQGGRKNENYKTGQYIYMGIGACYILMPEFLGKVGALDASAFLYGEEALLAGQLNKVNARTYYDPDLKVAHRESAALSKIPSRKVYEFAKESYPKYKEYL